MPKYSEQELKKPSELGEEIGREEQASDDDRFFSMIAGHPELAVDYRIVKGIDYGGYESHRRALKTAFGSLDEEWSGDPGLATGTKIDASELFSSEDQHGKLRNR